VQQTEAIAEVTKSMSVMRKSLNASKKQLQKYMEDNELSDLALGSSGKSMVRTEQRAPVINKNTLQKARSIPNDTKKRFMKEVTSLKVTYKLT
jgi:hypothetical protein